jgi:hypothetical protein
MKEPEKRPLLPLNPNQYDIQMTDDFPDPKIYHTGTIPPDFPFDKKNENSEQDNP